MKIAFDAKGALEACISELKEYSSYSGTKKVVLGISGGKDSTIAAALCVRAFGAENVHGLLLPCGSQTDVIDLSKQVCEELGIGYTLIDILEPYKSFISALANSSEFEGAADGVGQPTYDNATNAAKINLLPRIRMATIRLWGQTHKYRMCGTGNLSETTVGYCTKDGDTSCDFNPLGLLTSVEVVAIGDELGLPHDMVHRVPQDDLCGKTDEDNLGVTYLQIHLYIRYPSELDKLTYEKIYNMFLSSRHKFASTNVFDPYKYLYTD